MFDYIIRRLILLPLTLFCIILVNFIIINLAPGDPVSVTEISPEGQASRKEDRSVAFGSDMRYLQFREHYGLTLPILFNSWPFLKLTTVYRELWTLVYHRKNNEDIQEMSLKDYDQQRIKLGDQSRFVMPFLLQIIQNKNEAMAIRNMASRFFIRGGTRQGFVGPHLSEEQKTLNKKIAKDNQLLSSLTIKIEDNADQVQDKVKKLHQWYESNKTFYHFEPTVKQKIYLFFFETRFCRYMNRVATLDFGTLRNDSSKTVLSEVLRRFKYSLTLAILPMLITFVLCQLFGMIMACHQNGWGDHSLNVFFLILYAIPIFVAAPFLIEKVALNRTFPFTDIPIPTSGFTSSETIYEQKTSLQRIFDIFQHICLPVIAIMYGTLAAEARLSRTAFLEVLRQDYVRTAWAKGVPWMTILFKHVGRNAAITIVTSIAGSLGIILGGSLIVETLFEINGFGKFFYDSIINRDYNVIMFSSLAGSLLTLIGYLVADIAYTMLDPRVTLE